MFEKEKKLKVLQYEKDKINIITLWSKTKIKV